MKKLKNRVLALLCSLLMFVTCIPTTATSVYADEVEDPVVMTYVGSDGISYKIRQSHIDGNFDKNLVVLSKVFNAAGVPSRALAECAYEFITSNQDQLVSASKYSSIAIYKFKDGDYRAVDGSYFPAYTNSTVTTIKAVSHVYDSSTHKCKNQVYSSGTANYSGITIVNADCGYAEPDPVAMTYEGSDGTTYSIKQSVIDNNLVDEKVTLLALLTAAGVPSTALAECAYEFTSTNSEKIAIGAAKSSDIAFYSSENGGYKATTTDRSVDFTSYGVTSIKALSHAYDDSTNKCTNLIYASGSATASSIATEYCNADNPDPVVITYLGSDGETYNITKSDIDKNLVNDKVALSTVFTAAEIPDTALAECAYEFVNSDGLKQLVRAAEYNSNICLYKWSDGAYCARNASTAIDETVLYMSEAITTINAVAHVYDGSTRKCTNEVYASGTVPSIENEKCDADEPVLITYKGSDGKEYPIYETTVRSVTPDSNNIYSLAEVFEKAGVPSTALAECSYKFTLRNTSTSQFYANERTFKAADYDKFGLYYFSDQTSNYWISTRIDKSNLEEFEWFDMADIGTITAVAHEYSESTHKCENEINISVTVFEQCGAEDPDAAVITYVGSDGKSYGITKEVLKNSFVDSPEASVSSVFEKAGIPDSALAECAYEFTRSNGESVAILASDYDDLIFRQTDDGYELINSSSTRLSYEINNIKAVAHTYDSSTHKCTNEALSAKDKSSVTCGADEPVLITYKGLDKVEYPIYETTVRSVTPDANSVYSLKDVFTIAGIPDEALAECSYEFKSSASTTIKLRAADYDNFGLFYDSENSCWRNTLIDKSKMTGGWYMLYDLNTITATSHAYSASTHKCTNDISTTATGYSPCGVEEPVVINYVGADGVTYPIYASTIRTVTPDENGNYSLKEVFEKAGIPSSALAECSYKFRTADGSTITLRAADYGNFGLSYDSTHSCWRSTLLDTSAVSGGWYKLTGIDTITALKHNGAASGHTCGNLITTGKQQTTACGVQLTACEDKNHDHKCDKGCDKYLGEHSDANKDHKCDYGCSVAIGEHTDNDNDHNCDYCKEKISEHTGGEANCTSSAICKICRSEYGTKDLSNHVNLKHFDRKEATTTEEGNIEYWYCDGCGLYYSNAEATKEIKQSDTVIAKLNKADDVKPNDAKPGTTQTGDNQNGTTQTGAAQTGDNSNILLWLAMLMVSGAAAAMTVGKKRKHTK